MKFSNQVRLATLLVSAAAVTAAIAQPAPDQKALVPTTIDSLQFDGQWPWLFLDRPIKDQGLDALKARGRVRPNELLETEKPFGILPEARGGVTRSVRTIFRDLYTGAEVWRLTSFTSGTVSHAYNQPWNANGRLIKFSGNSGETLLMDQETCATEAPAQGRMRRWSPTEPYLVFFNGPYDGKRGTWAYNVKQQKALRYLAPLAKSTGDILSVSDDGKWVCWLEGGQDLARRLGVAATDGSVYRSIRYDGGVVTEIKNPTPEMTVPESTAGDSDVQGGMHNLMFLRSPDNRMLTAINGELGKDRSTCMHILGVDGKLLERKPPLSHGSDGPGGKLHVFEGPGGVRGLEYATGKNWLHFQARGKTEGHTSWTNDPNWAECSWQSPYGWEIVRLGMREDASPIRLCGVCPQDPQTLTYNGDPFGLQSPDGTKVMFMSSMMGSMNEYFVVAANPRPPRNLTAHNPMGGIRLTWTPDKLSGEIKGYRIYQTDKSGQNYRQIGWVDTPESPTVPYTQPISFLVPNAKDGDKVFFAVRAQEWSGLLSRYSNEVSSEIGAPAPAASAVSSIRPPVAGYIEAELCEFTGFKQGFDPVNAGDMYYLFVPTADTKCEVSFEKVNKEGQYWVRVGSMNGASVAFSVNGKDIPAKIYEDWTWVNLGRVAGDVKLSSSSKGFKLDRFFVTSDGSVPVGKGLDYQTQVLQVPTDVKTKPLTPFAAEVTWAAIPVIRYYSVHAADKPDFTPAQSNLLYSPPAGTERIVDWGLKPGTQYYYKVTATDYDGTTSPPPAAALLTTPPITVHTVNVDYTTATGGTPKTDDTGKYIMVKAEDAITLKFNVPADGDYVIWHQWRATIAGDWQTLNLELNGKKETIRESSHMGGLYGRTIGNDWLWTRFCVNSSRKGQESIYPLKAGEQTLTIKLPKGGRPRYELHLNKLIITNDQSFIPDGKLCIY
ncbi:MAG: fibronectin type III domain-containing protein [Phycisphaerales bacterium]|nr:fibronectin type III domain-containing protein [Phycisphaerales bacterium]